MAFYITGDKHGKLKPVKRFAKDNGLAAEDTIVILGDAGFNFFKDERDEWTKKIVAGIERRLNYRKWYCGHWHIEKIIDRMRFMYNEFAPLSLT